MNGNACTDQSRRSALGKYTSRLSGTVALSYRLYGSVGEEVGRGGNRPRAPPAQPSSVRRTNARPKRHELSPPRDACRSGTLDPAPRGRPVSFSSPSAIQPLTLGNMRPTACGPIATVLDVEPWPVHVPAPGSRMACIYCGTAKARSLNCKTDDTGPSRGNPVSARARVAVLHCERHGLDKGRVAVAPRSRPWWSRACSGATPWACSPSLIAGASCSRQCCWTYEETPTGVNRPGHHLDHGGNAWASEDPRKSQPTLKTLPVYHPAKSGWVIVSERRLVAYPTERATPTSIVCGPG